MKTAADRDALADSLAGRTGLAFLAVAPVRLAFGTSGLRGLVHDITDLEAYIQVKGAVGHLIEERDIVVGSTICLGGDLRPSTPRILAACARAIVDAGCTVEYGGLLPSPALIAHAMALARGAVMVTGSHIPFDRNGIKLCRSAGEILKSDEAPIERAVARVRIEEYARSAYDSLFDAAGMLKRPDVLPPVDSAAIERYLRRYVEATPAGALKGLSVLFYQHSAVGRDLAVRLLEALGAEVIAAGRTDTFVALDTENITDEQLDRIEALVLDAERQGRRVDAVVSTDGDSDRPLMLAVLPAAAAGSAGRRVRFLPGDLLGIVVAEYLAADAVVVPISSNDAVDGRARERGAHLVKCRIGSPWVIAAMADLARSGRFARIAGWEANGGFLTGSAFSLGAGTLPALPTRDAMLPIVANLLAAVRAGVSLDALWSRLPARFGRSGLLDGISPETGRAILALLVPTGPTVEVRIDAQGGILAAGAPLPAAEEKAWWESVTTLSRLFTVALGFPPIVGVNVLDGVRVHFQDGDVAHIRPSGNAPQLRIYANSDSQARADRIVELGVAEPDGILAVLARMCAAR